MRFVGVIPAARYAASSWRSPTLYIPTTARCLLSALQTWFAKPRALLTCARYFPAGIRWGATKIRTFAPVLHSDESSALYSDESSERFYSDESDSERKERRDKG